MLTFTSKFSPLLIFLASLSWANAPVIWNGTNAKFLNSGSVIIPGLAGVGCAQFDVNGKLTNTASSCGSGSGTISSGTSGQVAYYTSTGTVLGGSTGMTYDGAGNVTLTGKINATTVQGQNWTASELLATDASKNAISVPYSTAPAASTVSEWDSNKNLSANACVEAYATTATAAGTTTLTVSSAPIQYFTGTTTQTVVLPVVSTLPQTGFTFWITNLSSGLVAVQSSGGNAVSSVNPGQTSSFTAILLTGTTAASWNSVSNSSSANITTSSVGTFHIESAVIGGSTSGSACTSDPCTIQSQTGSWLNSVTWSGTGQFNLNIKTGEFSAEPTCTCGVDPAAVAGLCQPYPSFSGNSATSFKINTYNFSGATTNSEISVICMGPS